MKYQSILNHITLLAASSLLANAQSPFDPFADEVTDYSSGTGFATDFTSGLGYTNHVAALGAPSQITPGDFGGPVTPFSPPFQSEQLLSIGEGGMAVFRFDPPIFNHPGNPFGVDFIIYGNTGFSITNGNFSGGGITDGSTFSANPGRTRVSVSADNLTYYTLDPDQAPTVDGCFPTDGSGQPGVPTDPTLHRSDFAGANYDRIQTLYNGSAGGTGYDLKWAQATDGSPVGLSNIRYVRIDVIEGKAEIDALSAVLPSNPMPSSGFVEEFQDVPQEKGWSVSGDPTLFQWLPETQRLSIQWDSGKPNSYFHLPLNQTLTTRDDFSIEFDLELQSVAIGTTPNKPFTFPLAIGLIDLAQATRGDYFRGTGIHPVHGPRGVAEWNYLPDSGFGATVSSGLISQDNQWAFQNTFPLELQTHTEYRIHMDYRADSKLLKTTMTADGKAFGPLHDAKLDEIFGNPVEGGFTDLNVDAFAISNYSDEGQSPPEFAGSIRATGLIDNIRVKIGRAPRIDMIQKDSDQIVIHFESKADNEYWLEQSSDLSTWLAVEHLSAEVTRRVSLSRPASEDQAFFRIRSRHH